MKTDSKDTFGWKWPVLMLFALGSIGVVVFRPETPQTVDQAPYSRPATPESFAGDPWAAPPVLTASTLATTGQQTGADSPLALPQLPLEPPAPVSAAVARSYIVKRGDTLGEITQQMYGSVRHMKWLMKANGITNPDSLREGQVLQVPDLPLPGGS